mmetsp:Transcript_165482/g.526072  ORF Transcript_165482/g.526072 Transcript_165482/m.526072 type:complete len:310 (-) Transcript_165482:753-1682(-)
MQSAITAVLPRDEQADLIGRQAHHPRVRLVDAGPQAQLLAEELKHRWAEERRPSLAVQTPSSDKQHITGCARWQSSQCAVSTSWRTSRIQQRSLNHQTGSFHLQHVQVQPPAPTPSPPPGQVSDLGTHSGADAPADVGDLGAELRQGLSRPAPEGQRRQAHGHGSGVGRDAGAGRGRAPRGEEREHGLPGARLPTRTLRDVVRYLDLPRLLARFQHRLQAQQRCLPEVYPLTGGGRCIEREGAGVDVAPRHRGQQAQPKRPLLSPAACADRSVVRDVIGLQGDIMHLCEETQCSFPLLTVPACSDCSIE